MAVTFYERPESRPVDVSASSQTETTIWNAKCDADEDEVGVYDAALLDLDDTLNGLTRNRIKIDPVPGRTDWFIVTLDYGATGQDGTSDPTGSTPSNPATGPTGSTPSSDGQTPSTEPLGPGYTFDISAETQHITQSRRTFGPVVAGAADRSGSAMALSGGPDNVVSPSGLVSEDDVGRTVWITDGPIGWYLGPYVITAASSGGGTWTLDRTPARVGSASGAVWTMLPRTDVAAKPDKFNYKGAIGVNGDKVEGCDVVTPRMEWSRTISKAGASMAYFVNIMELVGTKNAKPFYGFAAGEVLFNGCNGTYSLADRYSVTHRFGVQKNKASVAIVPGELTIPIKRGWDYLWVRYSTKIEVGSVAPKAVAAFVEEVYADADFSLLGINI